MTLNFTKMEGLGNDYIYVDATHSWGENREQLRAVDALLAAPEHWSEVWSDRHTGIGADGLVLIGRSSSGDFSMRIFNADGSEAKMCGNASRCIGKFVYEKHLTTKTSLLLETKSGLKQLTLYPDNNGKVALVSVGMGQGKVLGTALKGTLTEVEALGRHYACTAVDMGNPHLVIFVEDAEAVDLSAIGPILEHHPFFEDRTNVEFVSVINGENVSGTEGKEIPQLRMRVWERGSGITRACGTGACATTVAAALGGHIDEDAEIVMDGGSLTVHYDRHSREVVMRGPARFVFDGKIEISAAAASRANK